MKFLADENISLQLIKEIRLKGYDILDLKEKNTLGLSDKEVLSLAKKESRILITHDKDFLDTFAFPKSTHCGIILIRLKNISPKNVISAFSKALDEKMLNKFINKVTVIDEEKIRIIS